MFKHVLYVSALIVMFGCSSSPNDMQTSSVNTKSVNKSVYSTQVTLSHIKAYLLLGNIKKAEQLLETTEISKPNAQAVLVLAELHAAKGNSIDAQKLFLLALTDNQFEVPLNKASIPNGLLDYFCTEKKWPALQGYGKAIIDTANDDSKVLTDNAIIKNIVLTKIGLCFFYQQRWDDTKYWLEHIDLNDKVIPLTYLALARANIEQQLYKDARSLISQYERTKDTVDAQTLWATIEVYMALKQPDMVTKIGGDLRSIFPNNQYTRQYILLTKRAQRQARVYNPTPKTAKSKRNVSVGSFYFIKKGETLYQLSNRYGVSLSDLLLWNPALVVDEITLGALIRISAP